MLLIINVVKCATQIRRRRNPALNPELYISLLGTSRCDH